MEINFNVQTGTEDEWVISGTLEGNLESKNLIVMIHGGGYDRDENGYYTAKENGKTKKDENGKTILLNKPYGNYQRLSGEIQALELDACILRIDLRNHGKSLVEGKMDERDTLFARFARDINSVINQMVENMGINNITIYGTCMGALSTVYYTTEIGLKEKNLGKNLINKIVLISPLSPETLSTTNPEHGFNYQKTMSIKNGNRVTKMKGVFEGSETLEEAEHNKGIYDELAKTKIPLTFITSYTDRLLPADITESIINSSARINPNFKSFIIDKNLHRGDADHCFYDPQSSDILMRKCIEELVIKKTKEPYDYSYKKR